MPDYGGFARKIMEQAAANGGLIQGVVTAVDTSLGGSSRSYTVAIDDTSPNSGGAPGAPGVRGLVPAHLGDTVWLAPTAAGSLLIVGVQGIPRWPNVMEGSVSGITGNRTPGTGGDWPNTTACTFSWRKYYDDTQVLYTVLLSAYTSNANSGHSYGVKFVGPGGTFIPWNHPIWFNVANQHTTFAGARRVGGLAAGLYQVTMQVNAGGGGNVLADSGDYSSLVVQEIPAPVVA